MKKRGIIPQGSVISQKQKVSPASTAVSGFKSDYSMLSEKEKISLCRLLSDAAIFYIESGRVVYLEGFGLLIPEKHTQNSVRYCNAQGLLRPEIYLVINFEKCSELTAYHRQRFKGIVELKELSQRIYPRLPVTFSLKWKEKSFRQILQFLLKEIRDETITNGSSARLYLLGTFYALHNRQGDNFNDWLAGSDLFLAPAYKHLLNSGKAKLFSPAAFETAWEPLQCTYGAPLTLFTIDVRKELQFLGFDLKEKLSPLLKVAAFSKNAADNEIIFCTDGLRFDRIEKNPPPKIEFTFQLRCKDEVDYINFAARTLASAWYLLYTKGVEVGSSLKCHTPINRSRSCKLTTIFATPFNQIRQMANSPQGDFRYMNIIWLGNAEADLAERGRPDQLLTLLRYKNFDQVTNLNRQDILAKNIISTDPKPYAKFIEGHSLINQPEGF